MRISLARAKWFVAGAFRRERLHARDFGSEFRGHVKLIQFRPCQIIGWYDSIFAAAGVVGGERATDDLPQNVKPINERVIHIGKTPDSLRRQPECKCRRFFGGPAWHLCPVRPFGDI